MTLDLYHAPPDAAGLITSGGTESIFLSVLAYREQGRRRGIKKANIVASNTVHVGFDKACFYLGMEIRKAPLTPDFKCNVEAMRDLIDSNTVLLVASCPDYAYGKFDPLPIIA